MYAYSSPFINGTTGDQILMRLFGFHSALSLDKATFLRYEDKIATSAVVMICVTY